MSAVPPSRQRSQIARPDSKGAPTFEWTLTDSSITDTVNLIAGPFDVLPVVFVPGIMGSNLKTKDKGEPIWRLDMNSIGLPWNLVKGFATKGPGPRQRLLHPDRCVVDDGGAVPSTHHGTAYKRETYVERGWGSVGQGSYHDFLIWLEEQLNPSVRNPAKWPEYYQTQATVSAPPQPGAEPKLPPGITMGLHGQPFGAEKEPFVSILTDDLIARAKFLMPVYAVGYNWLDDNDVAAKALKSRIVEIIRANDKGQYRCKQVILVTHSMGGLVARACAQMAGMTDSIAGIVHGVMPSVGAAVAYRRCKLGMRDEDFGAGLVIGSDGQEVTAVFAQAPGALELLPCQSYAADWLRVLGPDGKALLSLPVSDKGSNNPYESIYLRRDRWWALVNETWLAPKDGLAIRWEQYVKNMQIAEKFHRGLADSYHPDTYVYYGADSKQKSFEKMTWKIRPGLTPEEGASPSTTSVLDMSPSQVRMDGRTPEYVGGETKVRPYGGSTGGGVDIYETSYWELHGEMQDGGGDGTVPSSSGAAPGKRGGANVKQQFRLTGFAHEPAFKDGTAQRATLYAITKIVGAAKRPA